MDENSVNKSKLVDYIADDIDVSKSDISAVLSSLIKVCSEVLSEGKQIKLASLGTLSVKERAERTGRNPKTGDNIVIPAKKVVKFKVATKLQDDINS